MFIGYFRDVEEVGSLHKRLQQQDVNGVAVVNAKVTFDQKQVYTSSMSPVFCAITTDASAFSHGRFAVS